MTRGIATHPDFVRLRTALQRVVPVRLKATLYRACEPVYANTRDLVSGAGSRRYGGRWNSPGGFAAVYLAQQLEGALAESIGVGARYGFAHVDRLPMTIVAVDVDLNKVVDLTSPGVRRVIRATLTQMRTCDWRTENGTGIEALTQAMGRACFDIGFEGMVVPSAIARPFKHVVVFPSRLRRAGQLEIRRPERLPE